MLVAAGVPEMAEEGPSKRLPDPRVSKPLVNLRLPFSAMDVLRFTPAAFEISRVELAVDESVPMAETDWADVPPRMTVPADAGAKFSVPPVATEMFPLMVWPGVPVILKFRVPLVMVRLSIVTALPPVVVTVKPVASISKFA